MNAHKGNGAIPRRVMATGNGRVLSRVETITIVARRTTGATTKGMLANITAPLFVLARPAPMAQVIVKKFAPTASQNSNGDGSAILDSAVED
jgi:hypothetical protein